ncbi:MAG TPA: hypothetical protein VGA20_03445 [Gemmatimonadales bacterium]
MACRPRVDPLVPLPLEPVPWDSAVAWARRTVPTAYTTLRLRWRYEDEVARWAGRATARIAPPDSLRLDFTGPLGIGAGAGVVVGDTVAWTQPPGSLERLVPAIPMLWAALGTVRPPAAGATAFTRAREAGGETVRYWRFVHGGDTLDYAQRSGSARELEAEWRRNGGIVARSRVRYDEQQRPAESRIDFPRAPARIEFTVTGVDTAGAFPPLLWRRRG